MKSKKSYVYLILAGIATFLIVFSCSNQPAQSEGNQAMELGYDNGTMAVFSGITIPNWVGVRFTPSKIGSNAGRKIIKVKYNIQNAPASLAFKLYSYGATPASVLYSQNVTGFTVQSWNEVSLTTPYTLPSEGIWVVLELPQIVEPRAK